MTTTDVITLGAILAGVQCLIFLGDRLWKKEPDPTDNLIRELIDRLGAAPQPEGCTNQHQLIATSLNGHLGAIKELAETMKGMQDSMREQLKADELRHQLMIREMSLMNANQGRVIDKLDYLAQRKS